MVAVGVIKSKIIRVDQTMQTYYAVHFFAVPPFLIRQFHSHPARRLSPWQFCFLSLSDRSFDRLTAFHGWASTCARLSCRWPQDWKRDQSFVINCCRRARSPTPSLSSARPLASSSSHSETHFSLLFSLIIACSNSIYDSMSLNLCYYVSLFREPSVLCVRYVTVTYAVRPCGGLILSASLCLAPFPAKMSAWTSHRQASHCPTATLGLAGPHRSRLQLRRRTAGGHGCSSGHCRRSRLQQRRVTVAPLRL
jgi:hypothetical protein